MKNLIVVIEDEEDLLELLEYRLEKAGYEVVGFKSTKKVEDFLEQEEPDLLLVDRNLSGVEGSEFIKAIRERGYQIPVIFVSAKDSDEEIEEGFLRGGDDYITKPYNINELLLRIKAMIKRTKALNQGRLTCKDILLDIDKREVYVKDKNIKLSKLEFNLLLFFMQNRNRVINRDELIENIWKDKDFNQDKTVNVAVNRLKKRIELDEKDTHIKSIRGVGYEFC